MDKKSTTSTEALDVINQEGKKVSDLKINQKVFNGSVNQAMIHEVLVMYRANLRLGTADTKTRDEVRGGGKKPWRQKGTGRARVGSIRSPLWRHGGVIFGPHPRSYYYRLPKKVVKAALRDVINDKINEKKLTVVETLELASHKTKDFIKILNKLKIKVDEGKILVVVNSIDGKLKKAAGNLKKVLVITPDNVNAHNAILADKMLIEKDAFKKIEERLVA